MSATEGVLVGGIVLFTARFGRNVGRHAHKSRVKPYSAMTLVGAHRGQPEKISITESWHNSFGHSVGAEMATCFRRVLERARRCRRRTG